MSLKVNQSSSTGVLTEGEAWHDCMQHAFEEAANAAESWEYGGAVDDAEFRMTRKATQEVAKRIRAMARRHDLAYHRKPSQ